MLAVIGQVTKYTTIKWPINEQHVATWNLSEDILIFAVSKKTRAVVTAMTYAIPVKWCPVVSIQSFDRT